MSNQSPEKDIMLAEDDRDDVEIFEIAMEKTGIPYSLRHAENGEVLFLLLRHKMPYILFMDINMPCKDGVACIMEIRKYREYDQLPVIMYTSFFTDKAVEDTYRGGANFFITKSNNINDLVEKLKKVFSMDWKDYLHFPPRDQYVLS